MSSEVLIAIMGIVGTLAGTLLGWFLNQLSQRGKLHIFVMNWHNYFTHTDAEGCEVCSCSLDEAVNYSFELEMDIYNSSNITKIMRDIKVIFLCGKATLLAYTPEDSASLKYVNCSARYNKIDCLNIPANHTVRKKLRGLLDLTKDSSIKKTDRIRLSYIDSKKHTKIINVPFKSFQTHFAQMKEATPHA